MTVSLLSTVLLVCGVRPVGALDWAPRLEIPSLLGRKLPNVVIAPAQFGVPADYEDLRSQLLARGHEHVVVAPLRRIDWLRIVPSILTPEFWTGDLRPTPTLAFFYEALDAAFADLERRDASADVAIIGHSIGGWVVRAYLGERATTATDGAEPAPMMISRVTSLVTLGTPHNAPAEAAAAAAASSKDDDDDDDENNSNNVFAIDQTRGLLSYINANFPPVADATLRTTCVCGNTTTAASVDELLAKAPWDAAIRRSPLLESLVALPSYAVLGATADPFALRGDGLIPIDAALMPGCASVVIDDCHHSGFIPTALDSIVLPDTYEWYGSPGKVSRWADALR